MMVRFYMLDFDDRHSADYIFAFGPLRSKHVFGELEYIRLGSVSKQTSNFSTYSSSHVINFNNRNKFLTAKLLMQGYRYLKLCKAFSKFYRRHFELIEKYHVSLKKLMQQGICNPEFYGDLIGI